MIPISYNLRSMAQRKATTATTIFGVGLVVFLFAAALMFNAGVNESLAGAGRADNVIIMRQGSDGELSSGVEEPQVGALLSRDEVMRTGADTTTGFGVGEVVVVIAGDKKGTNGIANVTIRGVPPQAMSFRPEVKMVAGRPPKPGTNEVMVGSAIRGRFVGIDMGQSFEPRKNRPAQVVGVFSAGGTTYESEVWGDIDFVRQAFGREGMVSSVRARLSSPSKYDAFKAGVEQDKNLGLEVQRERDYYEKQADQQSVLGIIGIIIAIFCSFGAMIGAAITMNAAVANRQREIGTLRALGFGRFTILFSFVIEALILSGLGCVLGILSAMLMQFASFGTMNMVTWSEIVIRFKPTGGILIASAFFAIVVGLIGGLIPAIRAARVSPLEAMRS